jgi:polar amino acid transport system permease protein
MGGSTSLADYMPFLLGGVVVTLQITFMAMAIAVPVAFVLAAGRMSKFALFRFPASFVIELFRGTSAVVQLFWAFYVLPFFGIVLSPMTAGVLVLALNEGSYFSEVVRASLKSIVIGQREAAVALHLPPTYSFCRIILPQALPIMIPPFGNALVLMLKFTALTSLVTIQDLSFRAGLIRTTLGISGDIYALVLVMYFLMALVLVAGVWWLERWANRRAGRIVPPLKAVLRRVRSSPVPLWALGR